MNQPDQVLQTQYAPANSVVYFNALPREPSQQYSAHISLLATSTNYLFASLTQQQQQQLSQQPTVESMELGFFADSAHKHLRAKFDLDKSAKEAHFHHANQQQYQNFYMTLPLFIVIAGILLNSSVVQKKLTACRSFIEQKGGISRALQATFQTSEQAANTSANTPKSPRRLKNEPRNYHLKKAVGSNDSSATESDLERSSRAQYQVRQNVSDSVFSQETANQDYEIINNEDVMDMQIGSGRKPRAKKTD
jgi:hypothetical protein